MIKGKTTKYLIGLASPYGWLLIDQQPESGMISFKKVIEKYTARINIYTTTGTVGTCLNHPSQGKTQLFRKHVTEKEMIKIFNNPRSHTGKGYQTK